MKAIAKYKFITYKQVMRLGIELDKGNISRLFTGLRDSKRPLVRKIPHRNGVAAKHYLTTKGREVLLGLYEDMEEEKIHFLNTILYTDTQDQKHRTTTIDIQIEIDFLCKNNDVKLLLCDRYFDTVGSNRTEKKLRSKTAFIYERKKSVKADIAFMLKTPTQKELYVLELENGKDTKKAVEKCINHAKALLLKSANEKYKFNQGYRTLWIFEHQSIMQATIDRLQQISFFDNLHEFFLFKPLGEIQDNFFENWTNIGGTSRRLYYI